jgi:hypothetical protein
MHNDPFLWTPAAEYAATRGLATDDIERQLLEGKLEGEHLGDGWYVARRTVTLYFPDPANVDTAELHLLALPLGRLLTAARRTLVLPLRTDDPDLNGSLDTLLEHLQGQPTHPVPFRLNGRDWCVDASLHLDLVMAILDFEAGRDTRWVLTSPAHSDGTG